MISLEAMVYEIHYIGATWCSTCKVIKPATEALAKRFAVSLVCKDLDDLSDEEKDTISKVPTIRIVENNTQIVEWNMNQVKSLEEWLQTHIQMMSDDF
jgi:thiol-disulfide isomerase/thioredoxin